jgi:hypothetical protein
MAGCAGHHAAEEFIGRYSIYDDGRRAIVTLNPDGRVEWYDGTALLGSGRWMVLYPDEHSTTLSVVVRKGNGEARTLSFPEVQRWFGKIRAATGPEDHPTILVQIGGDAPESVEKEGTPGSFGRPSRMESCHPTRRAGSRS